MNIGNYKKNFNNETYEIYCYIYNNDISLTYPELINKNLKTSLIPTDLILYFMVSNSMTKFVPEAIFEIIDDNHCITNKLKAQNTRIGINISKDSGDSRLNMFLTFIVKDYLILEIMKESIKYKIITDLDNSIPLNTICEYATTSSLDNDVDILENPYVISKNILNQVGYKLYDEESLDSDKNNFSSKLKLPFTNELCNFITYQNMKAIDAIKYLFSYAVGEGGFISPAYFIHNLYDDKGYITSCENIWSAKSIEEQPPNTKIDFSISKPIVPSKQFFMTDVTTGSKSGGIDFSKIFFNYKFFEYDQENRKWEMFNVSKNSINDIITKGINNSLQESIYTNMLNEDFECSKHYSYSPNNHQVLYDVLKQLELYSSNLMFSLDGDLRLDVGQVINIYETGINNSRIEQFNGPWLITKIQHSFRNKEYKCHLICSRRFNSISK